MTVPISSLAEQVDFVIITALEEERDALLSKLDGFRKLDRVGEEPHTYYEARLQSQREDGTCYRVIATMLAQMGPYGAASKAAEVVRRWQPRRVLMVGIAGGIAGEIGLGDVLVASEIHDDTLGKVHESGKREVRWQHAPVDATLLDAAMNFSRGWEDLIREDRPVAGTPVRRAGPFVSGGDVNASPGLIAEYKKHIPKLAGVEMEGGALGIVLHGTECRPGLLMIRGISDLADAQGNAETKRLWRRYACEVAASYAVALIRQGPNGPSGEVQIGVDRQELLRRSRALLDLSAPTALERYFPDAPQATLAALNQLRDAQRYVLEEKDFKEPAQMLELCALPKSGKGRHLVVGAGGSGKTTAIWRVARALEDEGGLAVFVPLGSFASADAVATYLDHSGLPLRLLAGHDATLLLDGWSEFAEYGEYSGEAERKQLLAVLSEFRIVATGRRAGPGDASFAVWRLEPFSVDVVRRAVTQSLGGTTALPQGSLEQLLRLPLALALFLLLGGAEKSTRGALLAHFHQRVALGVGIGGEYLDVLSLAAAETRFGRNSNRRADFDAALLNAARTHAFSGASEALERLATLKMRLDVVEPVHDLYWEWLVGVGTLRNWERYGLGAVEALGARQALQLATESGERLAAKHASELIKMDLPLAAMLFANMPTLSREERQVRANLLGAVHFGLASTNLATKLSSVQAAFTCGDADSFSAGLGGLTYFASQGIVLPAISSALSQTDLWANRDRIASWLEGQAPHASRYVTEAIRESGQERWVDWVHSQLGRERLSPGRAVETALSCTSSLPTWVREQLPVLISQGEVYRLQFAAERGGNLELANWVLHHYDDLVTASQSTFVHLNNVLVRCGDDKLFDELVQGFDSHPAEVQKLLSYAVVELGSARIATLQTQALESDRVPFHPLLEVACPEVPEEAARRGMQSPHQELQLLGWQTLAARNPEKALPELLANVPPSFSGLTRIPTLEAMLSIPTLPEGISDELMVRCRGTVTPKAGETFVRVMARTARGLSSLVRLLAGNLSSLGAYHLGLFIEPLQELQRRLGYEFRVRGTEESFAEFITVHAVRTEQQPALLGKLLSCVHTERVLDAVCDRWRQGDSSISQALRSSGGLPRYHAASIELLLANPDVHSAIEDVLRCFSKGLASFPEGALLRMVERADGQSSSERDKSMGLILSSIARTPAPAHRTLHTRLCSWVLGQAVSNWYHYRNAAALLGTHSPKSIHQIIQASGGEADRSLWLVREVERIIQHRLLDEGGLAL